MICRHIVSDGDVTARSTHAAGFAEVTVEASDGVELVEGKVVLRPGVRTQERIGQCGVVPGIGDRAVRCRVVEAEDVVGAGRTQHARSEEHTSELQSLMRISYAVFCLKKKRKHTRSHSSL